MEGPFRRVGAPRRWFGGVCAAVADRLGWRVGVVRLVTVLAAPLTIPCYGLTWLLVPAQGRERSAAGRAILGPDRTGAILWGVLVALVAAALLTGPGTVDPAYLPVILLLVAGALLLWRQVSLEPERLGRPDRLRLWAGLALVFAAMLVFGFSADADAGIIAALSLLVGLALAFAPRWWQLHRELDAERKRRAREQERAEIAAHLHDGVMQTLSLIQRHAGEPREVSALARRQERELRSYLFGGGVPSPEESLASAVAAAAAEVEDGYRVRVEVVAVGDRPLDDDGRALVAAAREAMTNAAKFAGVPEISVFVEAAPPPGRASVFVRDRGAGFDTGAVPADRRGVAESIVGRMARHGGRATIRSAAGEGTEVALTL